MISILAEPRTAHSESNEEKTLKLLRSRKAVHSLNPLTAGQVELNKHSSNQVHPVPVADPSTVNSTIVPGRDMAVTPKR